MTSATPPTRAHAPLGPHLPKSAYPSVIGRERETLADCYTTLASLRDAHGLYVASPSADYHKAWIRDNVYEAMPFADKTTDEYQRTYHRLLDVLRRHEWKIDAIIREKPSETNAYIHARFHPVTLHEFHEPWGNKQNDATGALMWGIAHGLAHDKPMLRDDRDRRLVQKLVRMHVALRYWEDPDNGMWEEGEELHASSIGAVVAGLNGLQAVGFDVPDGSIERGREALERLLPRESPSKTTDLALLSLIWPYRVVTPDQRAAILRSVEDRLLRERGVIRYEGDSYYCDLATTYGRNHPRAFYRGREAEWTFGLPWLSLIYREMGNQARADHFLERAHRVQTAPGVLPELYHARSSEPNPNTPLGWSVAMMIMALEASLSSA